MTRKKWDIFICHASEDKDLVARPLASELDRWGVKVWYDEFSLKKGDSLSESIDRGLALSKKGVVVLSPAFMSKGWPKRELKGLVQREITGGPLIIPIWHGVGHDDVVAFSPPLADPVAFDTSRNSIADIAHELVQIVRPDIYAAQAVQMARLGKPGPVQIVPIDSLQEGPIRHASLPERQMARVRLIQAALAEVRPLSLQEWSVGFRRDLVPAIEIGVWERIAAVYTEVCSRQQLSLSEKDRVYRMLLAMNLGKSAKDAAVIAGLGDPALADQVARLVMHMAADAPRRPKA